MKKILMSTIALASLSLLAGCSGTSTEKPVETTTPTVSKDEFDKTKDIKPYTRDTTSGTRDGFCTKIGIEAAKSKDSLLTSSVSQTTGNGDMMTKVAQDVYGIGYSSLASVSTEKNIKALTVEGVTATAKTVVDGSYTLQRNFNMAYATKVDDKRDETKIALIKSYVAFASSTEGQAIIIDAEGGIVDPEDDFASGKSFADMLKDTSLDWVKTLGVSEIGTKIAGDYSKIQVNFVGSTSVEAMSEALSDQWTTYFEHAPEAAHNHTGSGDAFKKLGDYTGDIGFASRDFNDSEKSTAAANGYTMVELCKDAICPIVNVKNPLKDIKVQQLRDIFVNPDAIKDKATSEENFGADYSSEKAITKWSDLLA